MDSIRPPRDKTTSSTDAEKLAEAIKKAKAERARKAVNRSLDRSIGSIKKRKDKKAASNSQAHNLKQAAALQQKNDGIVAGAIKAKQYNRQLEIVNNQFAEQQRIFEATLAADKRKIDAIEEENVQLKKESAEMDKMLILLRTHLMNAGIAIDSVKSDIANESMESDSKNSSDLSLESEISIENTSDENDLKMDSYSDEKIKEIENNTNHDSVDMELTTPNAEGTPVQPFNDMTNTGKVSQSSSVLILSKNNEDVIKTSEELISTNQPEKNNDCNDTDENSLSVLQELSNNPEKRLSQRKSTDSENEPSRRSSRRSAATKVVSYAEPSIGAKLRRGDKIADESLFKSFSPKKRRSKPKESI